MAETTLLQLLTDIHTLPKKVIDTGCDLIQSLLGYPFSAAGGYIGDTIYQHQCNRRVEIAARVKRLLDDKGVTPKVLAPGFLLTYFEAAGNVDENDELEALWAKLLVSAIENENHQKKAFVNALRQLGPAEATYLLEMSKGQHLGPDDPSRGQQVDPEVAILLMAGIMDRHFVTHVNGSDGTFGTVPTFVMFSPFGVAFMEAVIPHEKADGVKNSSAA